MVYIMIYVSVSIGELMDKYSILLIKKERICDDKKIELVNKEIDALSFNAEKYVSDRLFLDLLNINKKLWEVEDKIREKEYNKIFDSDFIELARSVYITNDIRAEIKRNINEKYNSELQEVKSYSNYIN